MASRRVPDDLWSFPRDVPGYQKLGVLPAHPVSPVSRPGNSLLYSNPTPRCLDSVERFIPGVLSGPSRITTLISTQETSSRKMEYNPNLEQNIAITQQFGLQNPTLFLTLLKVASALALAWLAPTVAISLKDPVSGPPIRWAYLSLIPLK